MRALYLCGMRNKNGACHCLVHKSSLGCTIQLNMPIRPIIEGETNWGNIDKGSEPADIEFLEQ